MFKENPLQSNRKRNWFSVSWLLYNIKLSHKITTKTNHIFNIYTLKANRFALGFRSNRVYQIDNGSERDLIKGYFNNFGGESAENVTLLVNGVPYEVPTIEAGEFVKPKATSPASASCSTR